LLSQRGYALDTTVEHTGTGRLATARTTSPSGAVIDLLFASSGIEPEIVSAAEQVEILDGSVCWITRFSLRSASA
jgi:hypothetical protein